VTSCGPQAANCTATTCSPVRRPGRTVLPVVVAAAPVRVLPVVLVLVLVLI